MGPTEATSNETAPGLEYPRGNPPGAANPAIPAVDPFAFILSTTRRSSHRLVGLLMPEAGRPELQGSPDSHAAAGRSKDDLRSARQEDEGKPRRLDLLRDRSRSDRRTAEPRDDYLNRIRETQSAPSDTAQPDSGAEHEAGEVLSNGVVASPRPAEGQPPAGKTPANPPVSEPPAACNHGGSAHDSAAPVSKSGSEWTGTAAGPTPNEFAATVQANTGKSLEPAGGIDKPIAQTSSGGAPARSGRANGAVGEFQNVLQHAARPRAGQDRPGTPDLAKSTPGSAGKTFKVASTESVHDLARIIRSQIGPRKSSMTLTMSPPELGRVRVEVRMKEEDLTVRFQAETPGGRDALRGKLDELKHALEQQGVRIDRIEVEQLPQGPVASGHRDPDGQPQPEGQSGQTPPDHGRQSAGQARQSFDQAQTPARSLEDSSGPEQRAGDSLRPGGRGPCDPLRTGVDVIV